VRQLDKKRKLFCEISPLTYKISVAKCKLTRILKDAIFSRHIAKTKQAETLPVIIYAHKSLIRRKLGNVDMQLQENKASNLKLAAPKVSGIIIKPGEAFSFWKLVGSCTERRGYKAGLITSKGVTNQGIGGGMCQFTNLIHWLVLHTPLEITEHHHHDGVDLFPDFGRQVPFGVGTSTKHNYLDYRFKNTTDMPFQLIVYTTEEYLCGELRAEKPLAVKYHIKAENEYFSKEEDGIYRNNTIFRQCIDKISGNLLEQKLIKVNHAKVMYDPQNIKTMLADI
jgi:vancomycin resistance protein VanW